MTYGETTVGQTISRLLGEHPDLDPSADGALDNAGQFHIGGADAVGLLIRGPALAEGAPVLDIGSGFGGPARQIARRTEMNVQDKTAWFAHIARCLAPGARLAIWEARPPWITQPALNHALAGWREDAKCEGGGHGGCPAGNAQFAERPQHVRLHRGLADEQGTADLGVGLANAGQAKHFDLTRRQHGR